MKWNKADKATLRYKPKGATELKKKTREEVNTALKAENKTAD